MNGNSVGHEHIDIELMKNRNIKVGYTEASNSQTTERLTFDFGLT